MSDMIDETELTHPVVVAKRAYTVPLDVWHHIHDLREALAQAQERIAGLELALKHIARPALGGKHQQAIARAAIGALEQKETGDGR